MLGGRARSVLPSLLAWGAALVATGLAAGASLPPEGSMATPALSGGTERIPVTVTRPAGDGPFPAVVILHDCSGLGPRSSGAPGRWSHELVAHGYVTIVPCEALVLSTRAAPHPADIVVYPGAHHSFDSDRPVRYVATRVNMNAPGGRGATTGGDPRAWADSIRRVTEFFDRILK